MDEPPKERVTHVCPHCGETHGATAELSRVRIAAEESAAALGKLIDAIEKQTKSRPVFDIS